MKEEKLYQLKPEFIYNDEPNAPQTAARITADLCREYQNDWGMFWEWLDNYLSSVMEVNHFFELDRNVMQQDWENHCLIEAWGTLEECYVEVKEEDEEVV